MNQRQSDQKILEVTLHSDSAQALGDMFKLLNKLQDNLKTLNMLISPQDTQYMLFSAQNENSESCVQFCFDSPFSQVQIEDERIQDTVFLQLAVDVVPRILYILTQEHELPLKLTLQRRGAMHQLVFRRYMSLKQNRSQYSQLSIEYPLSGFRISPTLQVISKSFQIPDLKDLQSINTQFKSISELQLFTFQHQNYQQIIGLLQESDYMSFQISSVSDPQLKLRLNSKLGSLQNQLISEKQFAGQTSRIWLTLQNGVVYYDVRGELVQASTSAPKLVSKLNKIKFASASVSLRMDPYVEFFVQSDPRPFVSSILIVDSSFVEENLKSNEANAFSLQKVAFCIQKTFRNKCYGRMKTFDVKNSFCFDADGVDFGKGGIISQEPGSMLNMTQSPPNQIPMQNNYQPVQQVQQHQQQYQQQNQQQNNYQNNQYQYPGISQNNQQYPFPTPINQIQQQQFSPLQYNNNNIEFQPYDMNKQNFKFQVNAQRQQVFNLRRNNEVNLTNSQPNKGFELALSDLQQSNTRGIINDLPMSVENITERGMEGLESSIQDDRDILSILNDDEDDLNE
ncbi:Conserved_hypothetical protein [Hexamita inflata]|uniref:Uncharacterized protein n=1 Tax=Hexamita inflata TaxID=28002 RepID=A0AA86N9H9_9EUKA|nr:Conserved hypothetical protein [Hexamita inflata]